MSPRPPLSRPIAGEVVGFALAWAGQEHGVLWITGDTVLYEDVRRVADRLQIGTAILHLGCVRFPVTGSIHYSMTAQEAVELCRLVRPRTAIPVHYEGWTHFRQGRGAIERELASAPGTSAAAFNGCQSGRRRRSPRELHRLEVLATGCSGRATLTGCQHTQALVFWQLRTDFPP